MNPRLADVLTRYPRNFQPLEEPELLGNAGGLSGARLWRYQSPRGLMVARAWPPGRTGAEVAIIHRWLRRAGPLGFVPVPEATLDGSSWSVSGGLLFEVAPWMPGEAEGRSPPSIDRVRSAFSALARFHRALGPGEPGGFSPSLAARAREIDRLPVLLDRFEQAVGARTDDPSEAKGPAREWIALARRVGPALHPEIRGTANRPVAVQPVIRDLRPDHVLFLGDRVTGLVDFGAMGIDPISADLARLSAGWLGVNVELRAEALDAYEEIRPLAPTEAALIAPFERSAALLAGARWVRWHFVDRKEFEDPSAVARGLRLAVERIAALDTSPGGSIVL